MKNVILKPLFFTAFSCVVLFSACRKDELVVKEDPAVQELNSEITETPTAEEGGVSDRSAPSISKIGGSTIEPFFNDGKWLGNVSRCGKGSFYGWYVINTHDSNNPYNYWTINGKNFGSKTGAVTTNSSGVSFQIISWNDNLIKVRPISTYQLDYKANLVITVRTSSNQTATRSINVIGMISNGRGYGQCTWEVAYQRKSANLPIPPSAYASSGFINSSYVPQRWDVINWYNSQGEGMHTGIIMSAPTVSHSNGITTYTFLFRERNHNCDEHKAVMTTKTFRRTNTKVIQGISSDNPQLGTATKYWR